MTQNPYQTMDASQICTLPLFAASLIDAHPTLVSHRRRPVHMMSLQTTNQSGETNEPFPILLPARRGREVSTEPCYDTA
ncbi:uncharacterized protein CLUP02_01135 [Colletotrichum lupini]|uniref:Uncharacterized protein n=1 Tax=Colletotrichum lupini TaxID=145971 RepID=A0A9Q8W8W2_9PEZI|nr:uncharacterized protein CLUP02_01135 [Colletotrichum lupini]UQC74484.1 hypothetical protein CLUP02_01135 [Colletotrichum lupini]